MIERGLRIPVLERGVPSPWDVGPLDFVCLSSPTQAITSSEPNFWPHSLQIHCNGLGPKIVTLHYYYYYYFGVCLCLFDMLAIIMGPMK